MRIPVIYCTPNKITLLRVLVGLLAVALFGRNPWLNMLAVGLTVTAIALDDWMVTSRVPGNWPRPKEHNSTYWATA